MQRMGAMSRGGKKEHIFPCLTRFLFSLRRLSSAERKAKPEDNDRYVATCKQSPKHTYFYFLFFLFYFLKYRSQ